MADLRIDKGKAANRGVTVIPTSGMWNLQYGNVLYDRSKDKKIGGFYVIDPATGQKRKIDTSLKGDALVKSLQDQGVDVNMFADAAERIGGSLKQHESTLDKAGFAGDLLGGALFHGGDILKGILKDPKRLLTGIDPASSKLWSSITGKDINPLINEFGGPTEDQFRRMEAAGIDTKASRIADVVAKTAIGFYAAGPLARVGSRVAAGAGIGTGAGAGTGAAAEGGGLFGSGVSIGDVASAVGSLGSIAGIIAAPKAPGVPGESVETTNARQAGLEELARADAALNSARKRSQMGRYGARAFRTSAIDRQGLAVAMGTTLMDSRPSRGGDKPALIGGPPPAAPTTPNVLTPRFGSPGRAFRTPGAGR